MGGLHIYRNTRTGASIETPCVCAGEDWEEITPEPAPPERAEPRPEPRPEPKPARKHRTKKE